MPVRKQAEYPAAGATTPPMAGHQPSRRQASGGKPIDRHIGRWRAPAGRAWKGFGPGIGAAREVLRATTK